MSLKSYLREVMSSHLSNKRDYVAHQGTIAAGAIDISTTTGGFTYIAPADGVILAGGKACSNVSIQNGYLYSTNGINVGREDWRFVFLPVKQGDSVYIHLNGSNLDSRFYYLTGAK